MTILALDPGNEKTGWVLYKDGRVTQCQRSDNHWLLSKIADVGGYVADIMAIEMVASYGMPVGKEIFETCVWIGRFVQAWPRPDEVRFVYRRDVKLELCGNARAKDANVRQALIDRFGPGRALAVGTKKKPGPLYGVSGDAWAALAVAVTATGSNQILEAAE